MTRKRNDKHSTQFGLWLRKQPEIDSGLGFVTTNIDYIWENYHSGCWMLLEEKRFMSDLTYSQKKQIDKLVKSIKDDKFQGFHLIQFEKTSPEDGRIYLDRKEIMSSELIDFLRCSKTSFTVREEEKEKIPEQLRRNPQCGSLWSVVE